MTASRKRSLNMTEGKLFGKILLFVLPLMATNLLQMLYNAADMIVVGLSSEPDAVGAIGITSSFVHLIVNIFMGFATGANVIVARHLGSCDDKEASKATHTAILLSVMLGAVGTLVGVIVSRPVLTLMGAEGKILDLAVKYTVIYFAGAPFIALTNYVIAIFRAKGDTKTPLYILTFSGILNVTLNLFFVLVCGLSVEGVALATVISTAIGGFILIWRLTKDDTACRFSFNKLRFDRRAFRGIWQIGLPAAIQGSLFSLSNIIIQSSILQVNNAVSPPGSEFQPIVKGNAASANLESFAYNATNAVYQAAITFTSQNTGAAKPKRVWRVMGCCVALDIIIATVFAGVIVIFNKPLLALYGVSDSVVGSLQHVAYEAAYIRLLYLLLPYWFLAFMETGSGLVRGLGRSGYSTIISLVGVCLFRIAWIALVFKPNPTLEMIYVSFPISWTITAIAQFACAAVILRRMIKRQNSELKTV